MPASVANATPCGKTMTAPTRPASASARNVCRFIPGIHVMNGNSRPTEKGLNDRTGRKRAVAAKFRFTLIMGAPARRDNAHSM
jgi:hypothetical protein